MNDVFSALTSRYANFSSRARRREYWGFVLLTSLIGVIVWALNMMIISPEQPQMFLFLIYQLAVIIPTFAVSVRRLHDLDKSGFWILILFIPILGAIYLTVIFCLRGTNGNNKYGEDPLDVAQGEIVHGDL